MLRCGLSHEATGIPSACRCPAIALDSLDSLDCPSNGFRFKGFYSLAIAFSCSATMFGISCERKAPISDCGAFSDERAREGFALGCRLCLHLLPGIGFACGFMLCFGRFVSFQIRLQSHTSQKACGVSSAFPGLLSCYCPPGLVFVLRALTASLLRFFPRRRCLVCLAKENGL